MFSHPIFNGTLCINQDALEATDENIARTASENLADEARWGRALEVLNSSGEAIETPGLVVLEFDEMVYDEELETFLPALLYFLVTDQDTLELSSEHAKNFRLGRTVAIVDADIYASIGLQGFPVAAMSVEPLYRLNEFGAIENAQSVIKDVTDIFMETSDLLSDVDFN